MNSLEWLDYELFGNPLLSWAKSIGVILAVWLVLGMVRREAGRRLHDLAESRKFVPLQFVEHLVRQTRGWFLLLIALFLGSRLLVWAPAVQTMLLRVVMIGLLLQMGLWATAALGKDLELRRERQLAGDPSAVAAMDMVGFVLRVAIWSVVLLLILDNLGVDITALVAGLGVGGIAVALAAQNILGDLFASLSIVLDKPFVVGDFLVIDDYLGSVERVGLKTTRVRSLSGEQLIFSNNDLLNSRIRNYGRMYERRVVFTLGVTYQTPVDKLKRIPTMIREAIEAQDTVRFERAHFHKYGDFALVFDVVYHVLSPDYGRYMDIQQSINLMIYERFEKEGIEFAYPTQTLHLIRTGDQPEPAIQH